MKKYGRCTAGILMALMTAASVLAGCSQKTQETTVQVTRVQTQAATRGTLEITGTYIGTMSPHDSVNVTPLVSGTVTKVNVKVGDRVEEGDVLCVFDDKAAQLQLESAENAVESAKAGKEAAQDQIKSSKKQAKASITSMEGQVKTLKAQKKASQEQLEQVESSLDALEEAQEAAAEAYAAASKIYNTADALYINYQAFLSANPDCATTAGLMAAAVPVVVPDVPAVPANLPDGTDASAEGGTDAAETAEDQSSDQTAAAVPDEAAVLKQETAAALLEALNEIPLTVEYLTEEGLNRLKDQMQQAQEASATAASGYTQAAASVSQLESGIAQLQAQIEALEDNIDAAEDAADAKVSTKAYDAQIKAAQTGVESAQYQVDLYTVTAPISGIIEAVNVSENQISAQGYPAFTISDKESMEVTFYVPEDVRNFLRNGSEVRIESGDGEVRGRVTSIGTAVDAAKGLFKIVAEITSVTDRALLTNTSVSLSLVTNSVSNEILIPFDAVYYDSDQAYVFVAKKDGDVVRAVRRDITAGAYNNAEIAVLEGLSDGEEVITTWGAGLKDGAQIEIIGADS